MVLNHKDAHLHRIADEPAPRASNCTSRETRELIDSSNAILARVNTQQGEFGDRDFDTRIKERPTKSDVNRISTRQ